MQPVCVAARRGRVVTVVCASGTCVVAHFFVWRVRPPMSDDGGHAAPPAKAVPGATAPIAKPKAKPRFAAQRMKKIIQADESVGKVSKESLAVTYALLIVTVCTHLNNTGIAG